MYEYQWAIYEENGKHHISSTCLEVEPIKEIVISAVRDYVSKAGTDCIVGYSDGVDQSAIGVASITAYLLGKPLFNYVMNDENASSLYIGTGVCSLVTAYASSSQQMKDILEIIERQGGIVKQVIAFIIETDEVRNAFTSKQIQFESLLSLGEIVNRLRDLDVPDKKDLNSKIELLSR